ncbi:MAG TPA: 30S ribosomal protein S12 methylthiotransferase RimO [Thermoanaerobaculaceae bacterium]|nr:30S ribosomal protein S12 methylthiotransferase RimO [Thermoanaerobaculaceae bacterium]
MKNAARPPRAPQPVKVGMIGLGCAKNLVDGEVMLGHLVERGARIVTDAGDADVVIVNTCGFIEVAKRESIDAILEVAQRKGRGLRRLVVAGCMAQRYAAELAAEIPEIDAFVGLDELERVPEAVLGELGRGHVPDQRGALRLYDHTAPRLLATGGVYAYLKVAEGCDNPCSFCHIPRMRGAFRSRTPVSLVEEARRLEATGVRELVLIAQDTTRYGEDLGLGRSGLRSLLEELLHGTAIPWIRFMYAYPATLDHGIFALMARESRLVPYLDIPLQHASRKVLKLMKRGGDARSYTELIARARAAVPDLAVRTTFIVGFPGEGDAEFAELEAFVESVGFDHVGVFTYSYQEENPGAALGDPVPAPTKEARRRALMRLQERLSRERNRNLRGRVLPAIVEGASAESEYLLEGRLRRQAPEVDGRLLFSDGSARPGDVVEVRVAKTYAFDLVGEIRSITVPAPARHAPPVPPLLPTLNAPTMRR